MADLDLIENLESQGRNVPNYRFDPQHTAQGFWQITDTNWRNLSQRIPEVAQYPNAMAAPKEVQRMAAQALSDEDRQRGGNGYGPWAPYNPRLASAIGTGSHQYGPTSVPDPETGTMIPRVEVNKPSDPLDEILALAAAQPQRHEEQGSGDEEAMSLLMSLASAQSAPQTHQASAGGDDALDTLMRSSGGPDVAVPAVPQAEAKPIQTQQQPIPQEPAREVDVGTGIPLTIGGSQPDTEKLSERNPLDALLLAAKDIGSAAVGGAQMAAQGFNNMTGLGRLNAPGHAPIEPGLQRLGDIGQFATGGFSGPFGAEASGAARAGGALAREADIPGTLLDDAGALRLFHGAARPWAPEEGAPLGRMRLDKAGTGEGYHAEGYGGYASESPRSAEWYRKTYGGEEGGALYELEHPTADPEHFLRWDLPLKEQSAYVKSRLRRLGIEEGREAPEGWSTNPVKMDDLTGQDIYHLAGVKYGDWAKNTSWLKEETPGPSGDPKTANVMRLAGIRGTRYPAGGPSGRDGKFNYSIFEPEALNVKRKIGDLGRDLLSDTSGAVKIPASVKKSLDDAAKGIETFFSPSSVDDAARAGEALIRRETGMARRASEKTEAQVSARGPLANPKAGSVAEMAREPWRPVVNRYVPEFEQYIAAKQQGLTPPKPALLKFIDFMESRSAGTTYQGPPELRELADVLQKEMRERRLAINAEPSTQWAGFIEDYLSHQWKNPPGQVQQAYEGAARQGSGRNLKQRSIPTISDGIDMGLVPETLDPIDMTMKYVANMDRYLAHNRIFRIGRDGGMIKFATPGAHPQGWDMLHGRLAERAIATSGHPNAMAIKAYAPEGFARLYNRFIDSGFMTGKLGGPAYQAILHAKNAMTQAVLSLSGYHYMAMAQEAAASAFADGIGRLSKGDIAEGLKQIGLGAIPGVKAIKDVFDTGRKMDRQYRGVQDYGPDFEKVAGLYAGAGGRMVGRGAEYQGTAARNYLDAFRKGTLRMEWKTGLNKITEGNPLYTPARAAQFLGREMARINETITAPLFDKMVPRLKAAAFYDEMSGWLAKNPMASYEQQLGQARRIADTMDDRFGEMVMDNIFWGQRTKQGLQLLATSLGWEAGSIRSIGGAAMDAARGGTDRTLQAMQKANPLVDVKERLTPRVRYVAGLGMAIAAQNAMMQYLKTGKPPESALDLTVPRTGGTTPEGAYERELQPGFEKDILGYWHDPVGELAGKISPAARLGVEGLTGRDYFGHEIAPFPKYTPDWYRAWGNHVLGAMTPIPYKTDTLKGSNIGTAERMMGERPAPERLQNPQREEEMGLRRNLSALKGQLAGLWAHGKRTTESRESLIAKQKEIYRGIEDLTRQLSGLSKKYQGSRSLYRPTAP